jgi:small subunit ribosomal protein S17
VLGQKGNRANADAKIEKQNVRTLTGRVVSDKMNKPSLYWSSAVWRIRSSAKVPRRSRKYHAHVDSPDYKVGDLVTIQECRPISKTKAWKVTALLEKSREI